jgi:hypothetical protein
MTDVAEIVKTLRDWMREDKDPAISPRPWRMWGRELRCPKPGLTVDDGDVRETELVASFPLRPNRWGGAHVADLYFVQYVVSVLPALLDALEDK